MKIPFTPSSGRSLGVEWELQLVDMDTRELTSAAIEIIGDLYPGGAGEHAKIKHELLQCTIEVVTGVCRTVGEARADLRDSARAVSEAAAARNVGVMCAGTHPISHWLDQKITPQPRYEELVEELQWIARRFQIFGIHIHVGVGERDRVLPILNALSGYIPHFLALTASSPYWIGNDTGLASARSKVFEALPRAGLPYQLSGWDQFERYMSTLVQAKAIESVREVWWDVRPHPDLGTVELRVCDGVPTLEEITVVAALAQCLVEKFDRDLDAAVELPVPDAWLLRENKWRAARFGLDAGLIVHDARSVVPVRKSLTDLVGELMPIAHTLDCADELRGVDRILTIGPSYQRQRAVAEASGGDLTKVVDSLLDEMASGLP
ncbi:MAG TPA: glutamate--cysteine ligase [Jiangellaceae bacterium]|nr:glutamate--cysteine ligase [Jiangellaceae bacterium]